jgi:hypothetical protein
MENKVDLKKELIDIAEILKNYPESLQPKVFDILTKDLMKTNNTDEIKNSDPTPKANNNALETPLNVQSAQTTPPSAKQPKKKKSPENYQVLKDLDLSGAGVHPSFKAFYAEKVPSSNADFNAITVYYLSKILGIEPVTANHIFTCYKEVNKKYPGSLKQSLSETACPRYAYIDITGDNYSIPLRGITHVEHDLPKQKEDKKGKS